MLRRVAPRFLALAARQSSVRVPQPMNDFCNRVVRFLVDDDGPTTVEYAMIIMLVFLAALTAITGLGQATTESFERSSDSIDEAIGPLR